MLLVDTSVLVDFFKGRSNAQTEFLLQFEEQGGDIAIPSFCVSEILQGARDPREWKLLEQYLGTQTVIFPDSRIEYLKNVGRIFFDLRRKGKTVRSTLDCMIAQIALDHGALLLHNDRDFEVIQTVRPLKTWQQ